MHQEVAAVRSQVLGSHGDSHGHGHDAGHSHGAGHGHHAHFSLYEMALPYFHVIIDSLNIIGVLVMFTSVLAVLPTVVSEVLPSMFAWEHEEKRHGSGHKHALHVRIMLSRGIMLGLDFMVASDVIETLCGTADIIKIMCIVAIRSFLGWERGKEVCVCVCVRMFLRLGTRQGGVRALLSLSLSASSAAHIHTHTGTHRQTAHRHTQTHRQTHR
jgi:uncharacterized membrane protein